MTHSLVARAYFPLGDLGRACLWYWPVDCQNQYMVTTEQEHMMMIMGAASIIADV